MTKSKKGQSGPDGQRGKAGKPTPLETLLEHTTVAGDYLNEIKGDEQGFVVLVNHGKATTLAVVGTSPCLESALYTACKSSEELTNIVMVVAAELVHLGIDSRDARFNKALMGPKGDA